MEEAMNDNKKKKGFKFRMGGGFMIVFMVRVVGVIGSWIMPGGG
ncbi:hypothetical protein [Staphylococcus epidermidis]|nr:hypothetical protein [Staphylococcus epidermidis]